MGLLAADFIDGTAPVPRFDFFIAARQKSIVGGVRTDGGPAAQREGNVAVGGNPFPVVSAGEMKMRGVCQPALAGGMPDFISRVDARPRRDAPIACDVHIEQSPAGLFVAVVIQIFHDGAVPRTDDESVGDGARPIGALRAAFGIRRRKIERRPCGAVIPAAVRSAGEVPRFPAAKGERERRLHQPEGEERFDGVIEGIAEQRLPCVENSLLGDRAFPRGAGVEFGEEILHARRPRVDVRGGGNHVAVREFPALDGVGFPEIIASVEFICRPCELTVQPRVPRIYVADGSLADDGRGIRHPSALIFQNREEQARIDGIAFRHALDDFRAAERFAVNLFLIDGEIPSLRFDEFGKVQQNAGRSVHKFGIGDDFERRRGSVLRDVENLSGGDDVGVWNRVHGEDILRRNAVGCRDAAEGIAGLDGILNGGHLRRFGEMRKIRRRRDDGSPRSAARREQRGKRNRRLRRVCGREGIVFLPRGRLGRGVTA